jgi:hypothetical protein
MLMEQSVLIVEDEDKKDFLDVMMSVIFITA